MKIICGYSLNFFFILQKSHIFIAINKSSVLKIKGENIYNIPNLLSLYRLLSVPFLLYIAILDKETLFFYWFLFNLFTDALDGFIARKFNMQTRLGAKFDSLADFFMYLLAMFALLHFKWEELYPIRYSFYIIIFYYVFIDFFSIIKFNQISSLHLISSKINGVVQSLFFLLIFTIGMIEPYYWIMFILATFSFFENMYFLIRLKQMKSNLKSVFWKKE